MQNPFANATLAALYIIGIVYAIDTFSRLSVAPKGPTLLVPMTILSLFVLSAAVMGFLFVYQPLRLYMEGHKKDAVQFFAKTTLTFACFALLFLITLLSTSLGA